LPSEGSALTVVVTVRYFAAAQAAAGCAEEIVEIVGDTGVAASVDGVLGAVAARHGEKLAHVLTACSVLLDEVAVRDRSARVRAGAVLDVLPPFAGG
jgi:molybdopterin converting factor small subunit